MNITCEQFENLIQFYVDDCLTNQLKKAFEYHLLICKNCRKKYKTYTNLVNDMKNSYKKIYMYNGISDSNLLETDTVETSISSYIDNELNLENSIKLKKMIINRPNLRKKLEQMYNLKKILQYSFNKTKLNEDFTKKILNKTNISKYSENKDIICQLTGFLILCIIWIIMLTYAIR